MRAPLPGAARAWIAIIAVAAAVRLLYGGYLDYQPDARLVSGGELAEGHLPTDAVATAPTPHPLSYLALSAALTPLGDRQAWTGVTLIGSLSLGALIVGCFEVGRRLIPSRWGSPSRRSSQPAR